MPKVFLKKFALRSPLCFQSRSLINAAYPAQVLPDPRTGELRVRDHTSLPAVGMYSVLTLSGDKILVRYIRKLPYVAPEADQGVSSYFYVRPTLEEFEVTKGTKFTLLVGDMHFIAEIDTVLSLPPLEALLTNGPSTSVEKSLAVETVTTYGESTDHSSSGSSVVRCRSISPRPQPELLSTPSQFSRNKELPTPPPTVKMQTATLPSTPQHKCQNCINIAKSPRADNASLVPAPVIPRQRVESTSFPSKPQRRNINVVQNFETDQKPPKRKCHDSGFTQATRTMAKDQNTPAPHNVAIFSTHTPNPKHNSSSQRVKRTSMREGNQDMQFTSSPGPKVFFHVGDRDRPLAYPSPATTKHNVEGTPISNSKAKDHSLGQTEPVRRSDAHLGDKQSNEPASKGHSPNSATGRHPQSPQSLPISFLVLYFEPAPISSPILPYPAHRESRQQSARQRTLSEQHQYLDATPSRLHSEKENTLSNPGHHYTKHSLPPVSPTKTARSRQSSPPASPPHSTDPTYRTQRDVSRPLGSKSQSEALNGSEYQRSKQSRKKTIAPIAVECCRCKESGAHPDALLSPLQPSPSPSSVAMTGAPSSAPQMFQTTSDIWDVAEPGPTLSGDAKTGFISKDIAKWVWSISLSAGGPIEECLVVDRHRKAKHH